MFERFGNVLIVNLSEIQNSNDTTSSRHIANNTVNTWQPWRSEAEKERDTTQGKIAEKTVEIFLHECTGLKYISYDDIRNDDLKKHAPCDGFIISGICSPETLETFIEMVKMAITNTIESFVEFNSDIRNFAHKNGIYFVEIKSTKVNQKKKNNAGFASYDDPIQIGRLVDQIMQDDYLTYPHYLRLGNIENKKQYILYLVRENIIDPRLNEAQRNILFAKLENELALPDIFIRVYTDFDLDKILIIGFITKDNFIDEDVQIKKMIQWGKSQGAIYLAKSLKFGTCIAELENP